MFIEDTFWTYFILRKHEEIMPSFTVNFYLTNYVLALSLLNIRREFWYLNFNAA